MSIVYNSFPETEVNIFNLILLLVWFLDLLFNCSLTFGHFLSDYFSEKKVSVVLAVL